MMRIQFDLTSPHSTQLGVLRKDVSEGPPAFYVPADEQVQNTLREMVSATLNAIENTGIAPRPYEPSEKYASIEYLYVSLNDGLASFIRSLHTAANLAPSIEALDDPEGVSFYFAQMWDSQGRGLTAIRRATQFKGAVKKRFIRVLTHQCKLVEDRVFRLDNDFDILVDATTVHILRPAGFEAIGGLKDAILEATVANVRELESDCPYVDFAGIGSYAATRIRAARLLASIRQRGWAKNIDKTQLLFYCGRTGVEVNDENGTIAVTPGHEMAFLELLDRRRYEVDLEGGRPDQFRAAGRMKINR